MMLGTVGPSGDATLAIHVRGPGGRVLQIQTVIDTGFNECLALSPATIQSLGLPFREEGQYTLADGSASVSRIFVGEAEWFGHWHRILIVELGGDALLGMGMLRGCHLGIDAVDGGKVEISPVPGSKD